MPSSHLIHCHPLLFLPTKLVPLPHLQDPLSSKLFQEGVHGVSKGAEVRGCPRAKAEHREPAKKTREALEWGLGRTCRGSSVRDCSVSSVAQSCPTLCNPMNRSMPGLPVHHQLLEFTQTHVHRICDAIQPSHSLSSPSPPAPNPSQHQSLFQ